MATRTAPAITGRQRIDWFQLSLHTAFHETFQMKQTFLTKQRPLRGDITTLIHIFIEIHVFD